MKVAVLTSSRADYGIYLPLLKRMVAEGFDVRIIAFGTHLSRFHGYTIEAIRADGFKIDHEVEHIMASDSEDAVATSMALTTLKFSTIWKQEKNNYKWVLCLGDRYEMFAAVSAGIPYGIPFAHIHAGETTLGAIDNQFRHAITLFSKLQFTATPSYSERVKSITLQPESVFYVGALGLNNLTDILLYDIPAFKEIFGIDLSLDSVLITFHPETIATDKNRKYISQIISFLGTLKEQLIITMPNADTNGNIIREAFTKFSKEKQNVILVENFGTRGYFSCMKYAKLMLGNTSSGIIEAASFGKYFINIGNRQEGRATSLNTVTVPAEKNAIAAAYHKVRVLGEFKGENIYYREDSAEMIINVLKAY